MKKIGELAQKYESVLTKEEKKFLTKFSFMSSNLHGLPNVHRSKQINEAINHKIINIQKSLNLRT